MATNTTNYGFKKPDESDFYDVADQNKNWDLADEALKNLDTPTFEDYTGSTAVPSATDAIDQIKSKGKLGTLLSNIKAAFRGACLIGHIVNNCVTDNSSLPLSAAQGKVLKDLYTQLYSEMQSTFIDMSNFTRLQLEAVWGGNKLIIGFVGWKGSFSPNNNTGVVFVGGSCAILVSITGEIYMQSSAQNAPVWEKRGIHYNDINVTITSDQWITSANGLKYFNYNEWNLPVNTIGLSANISSWAGTSGNVTCSIYNNSYIQFRCENAVNWTGTVRIIYFK